MITHQEIKNLVSEWGLREDVIEKDYVLGWVLWAIGTDPDLSQYWTFKGGTSLKKCYIETWRFSEDLDFTVLPGGPSNPTTIEPIIKRVLERVHDESGIDFSAKEPAFKHSEEYIYTEGSIYYRGPRNDPRVARIKLDISGAEKVVCPTVLRKIAHAYSDGLPDPAQVRCYAFEEVFAEKLRAMAERGRPRDLYDITLLYRRRDLKSQPNIIKSVLDQKCQAKGIATPTIESIYGSSRKEELVSDWENMLGHQLNTLPSFEEFWEGLPNIFNWLNGKEGVFQELPSVGFSKTDDQAWTPPPTVWRWGLGVPLESVRFAAVNHLCIELGYNRSVRLIEPYSLRRTKDGNLLLYAWKIEDREIHAYRVDRMESIKVSTKTFKPRYRIEFFQSGMIQAPYTARRRSF